MERQRVIVIGAGIGGLAAALDLSTTQSEVCVFERHSHAGGKLRARPSAAGPVDTGPTVLTMKENFEALFEALGERLDDHIEMVEEPLLARHYWPDGGRLDLFTDRARSAEAIRDFAGKTAEREFRTFCDRTDRLLRAFEAPVMRAPRISLGAVSARVLSGGWSTLSAMAPLRSMAGALGAEFSDPRLAQLFGRYATYVGGAPQFSPALLRLIWAVEERGVWRVPGGMASLAAALARLAEARGVRLHLGLGVERIEPHAGQAHTVITEDGARHHADAVVFNGDPAALHRGLLGTAARSAVPAAAVRPRSHSAAVWAFAAEPKGLPLAHHNVFFNPPPETRHDREFYPISHGARPGDPALYVCAQDRGSDTATTGAERFEIIMNAPPVSHEGIAWTQEEKSRCHDQMLQTLSDRGLWFAPAPGPDAMTSPAGFSRLFPASDGSLYGLSPHGTMASFHRPTARTRLPGLYLAGGGAHPGPGIPMALLSGRHAAAAIVQDRISTSSSRPTDMPGGISTASPTTANGPSPSSPS